jgi:hypothetical protein
MEAEEWDVVVVVVGGGGGGGERFTQQKRWMRWTLGATRNAGMRKKVFISLVLTRTTWARSNRCSKRCLFISLFIENVFVY